MKRDKFHPHTGFTLIEVIVVITIISVLAAVSAPSIAGFVDSGKRTNRSSIARTIYLAAQNQLTGMRITNNLKSMLDGDIGDLGNFYNYNAADKKYEEVADALTGVTNVSRRPGIVNFPDTGNEDYIHYISKPKGAPNPDNPVVKLLEPVILDKTVLYDAILIEYNIRTGVVLSAFYSDVLGDGEYLDYLNTGSNRDISGDRIYTKADSRNQGYYGVGNTGIPADEPLPAAINVYDSYSRGIPGADGYKNILYAEIMIPQKNLGDSFDLYINDNKVETGVSFQTGISDIGTALSNYSPSPLSTALFYKIDVDAEYARIIWILDYVGGNMTTVDGSQHSIGAKYTGKFGGAANLRASIKGSVSATSFTEAHPYFFTEGKGSYDNNKYTVKSARHLYNIRYLQSGDFTQRDDIDLASAIGAVTNFTPIPAFTGTYNGTGYAVKNLTVNTPSLSNTGLFGNIASRTGGGASVVGLTLENPSITGGANTGAVAGTLEGFITGIYVRYPAGSGKKISGTGNVGGIIGTNNGTLTDSVFISPAALSHVPIAGAVYTGGIAGVNNGGLKRVLFLALAPENGSTIYPFAGLNTAAASNLDQLYYLSGTALRPGDDDMLPAAYNLKTANVMSGTMPIGTDELYRTVVNADWELSGGLSVDQALSLDNLVYPYPRTQYSKELIGRVQSLDPKFWPIVKRGEDGLITINDIAYYEEYSNGSYGLWFLRDGEGNGSLKDNLTITKAGYVILLNQDITGVNYFFAKGDGDWQRIIELDFEQHAGFARAVGKPSGETIWACVLPLDTLSALHTQSRPLQIMYTISPSGVDPKLIYGSMQPLFAKGLYSIANPDKFYIRTPWQLKNISFLTGAADHTEENTFKQEIGLDFSNTGVGVNAATASDTSTGLNRPAVDDAFRGTYDGNGNDISNVTINNNAFDTLGLFGENRGSIKNLNIKSSTITGRNYVGAIAGSNFAVIDNCKAVDVKVYGIGNIGGVAGGNSDKIIKTRVESSTVSSLGGNIAGGITGTNTGTVDNCGVANVNISSVDTAGGAAGNNSGKITQTRVEASVVESSGGDNAGGIVGINSSDIELCMAVNNTVTGANSVGGAAGNNSGKVTRTGVENSTVKTNGGSDIGGVAGYNSGTVSDVFFLSTQNITENPVANNGGGIVGYSDSGSDAAVAYAFYLAPAPKSVSGGVTTIYPIVRTGEAAQKTDNGNETCFYLSGSRYSLDEGRHWTDTPYNGVHILTVECGGGGTGLITKFIDREWIDYAYEVGFDGRYWLQPSAGYPYLMLRSLTAPLKWPVTDSPPRPDQQDRTSWEPTQSTSDRAINLEFMNGDFTDTYLDSSYLAGNAPDLAGENGFRRQYVPITAINGWNTRPVNAADYSNRWNLIEFQEPVNVSNHQMYNEYMYTNYQGNAYTGSANVQNSKYRYAELNADVQGTLYQLCPTTPGAEFYYSFHHATRLTNNAPLINNARTDMMNFYLTGVSDTALYARDDELVLIRPCWSPRVQGTTTTSAIIANRNYNPAVKYSVAYGAYRNNAYVQETVTFYDRKAPNARRTAYLYDVWVTDLGYGITFWSDSRVSIGTRSSQLPQGGVTNITQAKTASNQSYLPSALIEGARDNVIGYWSERNGWKQYYGLYTVPDGQRRTEFAYQSRTPNPFEGNYLDGITFKSPAFLSVDKYAKIGGVDVSFVKPGDTVRIELAIKSWGEIPAGSIVIKDSISSYEDYISYAGNISVKKGNSTLSGVTVTTPNTANGQLLTVALPSGETLSKGEVITVSFDIKVHNYVGNTGIPTLMYYFKNQAVIEYRDSDATFNAYSKTVLKRNGSGPEPVQVFIDPVKLTKTVKTSGLPASSPDPLVGGPFEVTLIVEDTLEGDNKVDTKGIISDVIPEGFVISDTGTLPAYTVYDTDNPDGSTRITIRDVNLGSGAGGKRIIYTYTLEYTGDGYGAVYTSTAADYKYLYDDGDNGMLSIMLKFPQQVVGIKVKTTPDISLFADKGTVTHIFDILDGALDKKLADDNYDVTPVVILTGVDGTPITTIVDGNYQISNDNFTATLVRGSNMLHFTPKEGKYGPFEIYYKVSLIATKQGGTPERFDLTSETTTVIINVDPPTPAPPAP